MEVSAQLTIIQIHINMLKVAATISATMHLVDTVAKCTTGDLYRFNPSSPEHFSQTYFLKGGCCNPPQIINMEGHITLNLPPVYYSYGCPLSTDTKISTIH